VAFPQRRHTQVATLSWQRDKYNVSDQLVGGSVLDVDGATHIIGSRVVAFDIRVRGLTWLVAEANAESGGFLEQVVAELLDVEVDAVDVSLENAAVEEDVVALENAPRACDVVRGGVATFPPVDVKGYDSLADWLRAEIDAWERAPKNVKKVAKCRARMADLVRRCAEAVEAEEGVFLRRASDPVGPDSRGPVDGEGVRPAVVGIKCDQTGRIDYGDGDSYSPEPAAVVDCDVALQRAADNGASFRNLDGSAIGTLALSDVDLVLVPPNYNVRDSKSVVCYGSQRPPGRNARYKEVRRFLWSTFFVALVDSDTTFDNSAALRREHAVFRLQDETRPPTPRGARSDHPGWNPWVVNRPPGWQEPPRRRGARRAVRGAT